MKMVLWISRHNMAPEQMTDLERIMGGPVCLRQWPDTVIDIADLAPAVREADAVAAVLPPELLAELLQLAEGRPVFFAVSGRVATGKITESREPEFDFVHRCWRQLLML